MIRYLFLSSSFTLGISLNRFTCAKACSYVTGGCWANIMAPLRDISSDDISKSSLGIMVVLNSQRKLITSSLMPY